MQHSPSTSERNLLESIDQLRETSHLLARVFRNLDESLPGFPSSTTGAAPSSGSIEPDGLLPVERLATRPADEALRDQDRVHALIETTRRATVELYSLAKTWGFDRRQGILDVNDAVAAGWCDSHLRAGFNVPIDRRRYERTCRWCGDFQAAQGYAPSVDLLIAKHEGRYVTRKMITRDRRARRST